MKTKTWKIGEYAKGGIITVEIKSNTIDIIGKDWDTKAGYSKSSNQSNAKEFTRATFQITDKEYVAQNERKEISEFLNDLTTSYYAGQIIEWIRTKITFPFWY